MSDAHSSDVDWLVSVYSCVAERDLDATVDILFGEFDGLLSAGRFAHCDTIIESINVDRLGPTLLVALLAVTLPASSKLAARAGLVGRVRARLSVIEPERVESLMRGLT